jgi:ABC-type branched-subunit amino acid transport system ATPase component
LAERFPRDGQTFNTPTCQHWLPNGAGKTTLFRMVVGEETPDEGAVSVSKKLTIGYFNQVIARQIAK